MSRHCFARQYSDQMNCVECRLVWDINDPDPPECQRDKKPTPQQSIEEIRRLLTEKPDTGQ